jgi:outer membrane protein assembly factor BamA
MTRFSFLRALVLLTGMAPAFAVAQSGELGAGISYSDRYGAAGTLGVQFADLLDGALDAGLQYRAGDKGEEFIGNAAYGYRLGDTRLGADTMLRLRLSGLASEWVVNPYDTRAGDFLIGVSAAVTDQARWSLNLVHNASKITMRREDVSDILMQDLGSSNATWVEAGLSWSDTPDTGLFDPALRLAVQVAGTVAGNAGRSWTSAALMGDIVRPVGDGFAAAFSAEARMVRPQSDVDRVHVLDRYFAAGRKPRGFAWGSAGPVDPDTDDALGGTRQFAASAELRAALPRDGLSLAAFYDAGAVWDLSGDAASGIDDSYFLRQSAGFALRLSTRIGAFEAAFARPIDKRDSDIAQPFSVQFVTQF